MHLSHSFFFWQRVEVRPRMACPFSVVVAIDFGTTSSGYAFSFTRDSEAIHMMRQESPSVTIFCPIRFYLYQLFLSYQHRRWEGGDPGVANQKSPTCLLLTPDLRFHSFGFAARDFYHDLDPEEARHWLYFDKFKMKIHSTSVRWIMRIDIISHVYIIYPESRTGFIC